jgi:hypothetical protein
MTDVTLRELERQWRATGDPGLEARYLAERLRTGRLARERLELAAYAGHGPAREALGDAAPAGAFVPWARWRGLLDDAGRAAVVRSAVAQLELARVVQDERHASLERALEAIVAWCACPCGAHARDVEEAEPAETLGNPAYDEEPVPDTDDDGAVRSEPTLFLAASRVRIVCHAVAGRADGLLGDDPLGELMRRLLGAARRRGRADGLELEPLVAWALGSEHAPSFVPIDDGADAEARWLLDRVARGELTRTRLALAAYALEPGARAALGDAEPEIELDIEPWVAGLARWGDDWLSRAAAWYAAAAVDPWSEWGSLLDRTGEPDGNVFVQGTRAMVDAGGALRRWADDPDRAGAFLDEAAAPLDQLARDPRVATARAEVGPASASGLDVLRDALRLARAGQGDPLALVRDAAACCADPREHGASLRRTIAWWALRATA